MVQFLSLDAEVHCEWLMTSRLTFQKLKYVALFNSCPVH